MKRRKGEFDSGALDLLEEAVHLLRRGPAAAVAAWYIGSLPFVLAMLYFWTDMSRNPFARERLAGAALGMAVLFVWMKCWQTVCSRRLLAHLCGEDPPPWTAGRIARMTVVQATLQPLSVWATPLMWLLPWVSAFFHTAGVLGAGGRTAGLGAVVVRSARLASMGSRANLGARIVLLLLALLVFANVGMAITWPAALLKGFLGIETPLSRGGFNPLNTTFLAILLGVTYLCVGPVIRAYYTLQCFYNTSLETGQDLQADLKRLGMDRPGRPRGAAWVLLAALLVPAAAAGPATHLQSPSSGSQLMEPARGFANPNAGRRESPGAVLTLAATNAPSRNRPVGKAPSAPRAVEPAKLDRSIRNVISRREFTWRMPREKAERADGKLASLLERMGAWIGDRIEAFLDWLMRRQSNPRRVTAPGGGWAFVGLIKAAIVVLLGVVVVAIAWLIVKAFLERSKASEAEAGGRGGGAEPAPDLEDESVTADEMPEEGWLEMARDLFRKGDRRLALRAMFLASLSMLAERGLIVIARFKSNREYQVELARRGHALPGIAEAFAGNVTFFEDAWYGMHDVTDAVVDAFTANQERIRGLGQT